MNKKIKMVMSTISPSITTRLMYLYNFHRLLNLNDPKDLNEKMQYLKLKNYYRNPTVTKCVDKYAVRDYLSEKGMAYLLPGYIGGGYNAEKIRMQWDKYPNSFVIKCNHGCGYNILVPEKNQFDVNEVVSQVN